MSLGHGIQIEGSCLYTRKNTLTKTPIMLAPCSQISNLQNWDTEVGEATSLQYSAIAAGADKNITYAAVYGTGKEHMFFLFCNIHLDFEILGHQWTLSYLEDQGMRHNWFRKLPRPKLRLSHAGLSHGRAFSLFKLMLFPSNGWEWLWCGVVSEVYLVGGRWEFIVRL